MKCTNCSSTKFQRRGKHGRKIKLMCSTCGKYVTVDFAKLNEERAAGILLLDIETLYMEVRGVWNLKTEYIPHDRITKDWSILCYAAKWLFKEDVMGESVTPEEAIARDEKSIIKNIWNLINEASVIVTQNGDDFDLRALNAKFAKHGLLRPAKYMTVDTKLVARRNFRLPSYSLDYMAKYFLGIQGKTKMVIEDWDACADGDLAALQKMLEYCKRDVAPLLEDLYLKFLPWIDNHPNMSLYSGDKVECCPKCTSRNIVWSEKPYPTPQGLWMQFRCLSCGTIGRGSKTEHKISTSVLK